MHNRYKYNEVTYNFNESSLIGYSSFESEASIDITYNIQIPIEGEAVLEAQVSKEIIYNIACYYYFQYRVKNSVDWINTEIFETITAIEQIFYDYVLQDLDSGIIYEYRLVYIAPNIGTYYGNILEFETYECIINSISSLHIEGKTLVNHEASLYSIGSLHIEGYKNLNKESTFTQSIILTLEYEKFYTIKGESSHNLVSSIDVEGIKTLYKEVEFVLISSMIFSREGDFLLRIWSGTQWNIHPLKIWKEGKWIKPKNVYIANSVLNWKEV